MEGNNTKVCKKCREVINRKSKRCPHCGARHGFPVWGIVLIVLLVFALIGAFGGSSGTGTGTGIGSGSGSGEPEKNKGNKVEVADFSRMTEAEIDTWGDTNKVNCTVSTEYSDSVGKGAMISQSVDAGKTIYEGDSIAVKFSLGKEPSTEYKNALKKAEQYSETMHMSKKGIYDQLVSNYGEQFPADAAQYAIDNIKADWNANALAKAKTYQETMSMSKSAIYDQLISQYGEQFTKEEAQYAVDHLN